MGFGFDRIRIGVARGGGGVDWRASPPRCGQLTRCFSAVAELLVLFLSPAVVEHSPISADPATRLNANINQKAELPQR